MTNENVRSKYAIEMELDGKEWQRISQKAIAARMTVGKLLECFVNDLVCGTYTNGSDERDLANSWFDRCLFRQVPSLLSDLCDMSNEEIENQLYFYEAYCTYKNAPDVFEVKYGDDYVHTDGTRVIGKELEDELTSDCKEILEWQEKFSYMNIDKEIEICRQWVKEQRESAVQDLYQLREKE